ncbi:MAG: 50S ribosomal protein L24 [Alphaproteobacteria bacterium CG11_big_fil_rev_8_21_14_0_20_44_7]|nr:MAG: 50S ribosomal protein L24 [Alphaproteobacteria bacterium CG11_big_fil_rev_8_21_14_0_20_44_7]
MAAKIKKGDQVIVLAGKDKGKKGTVDKVLTAEGKAIVPGINQAKKHQKPSQTDAGGIKTIDKPIQLSNLAIADPKDGKPTRVGFKIENGKKIRIAKRSGEALK